MTATLKYTLMGEYMTPEGVGLLGGMWHLTRTFEFEVRPLIGESVTLGDLSFKIQEITHEAQPMSDDGYSPGSQAIIVDLGSGMPFGFKKPERAHEALRRIEGRRIKRLEKQGFKLGENVI